MRVLVCYGTTEGQTRKIAEFVEQVLSDEKAEVRMIDASSDDTAEIDDFDAAIMLGSVHIQRYQTPLVHRVTDWHEALNRIRSAFISVSLSAAGDDPEDLAGLDKVAGDFFQKTGWTPDKVLQAAGAFRFTRYDFFKAWAMRLIARQKGQKIDTKGDTEYTDWDAVRDFVRDFVAAGPKAG